mgnify:CR=1 FL=1
MNIKKIKPRKNRHNTTPKSYLYNKLYDDIIPIQKHISSKPKKIIQDKFKILRFAEYPLILKNNYNRLQLRMMCKKYKQKISGNKDQLKFLLYNFLKYSYYATKIQYAYKTFLIRKINKLKGPGLIHRKLCVNETDFLSLESIKDIPYNQFFSYTDEQDFVYGFNIVSLYTLAIQKKNIKNPYNRNKLPENILQTIKHMVKLSNMFDIKTNVLFNNDQEEISFEKKIKFKTINLFTKIDQYGFITNIEWFLNLNRIQLCKLIKELKDVWNYRLQIPFSQKIKICPSGNPFTGYVRQLYINKPFHVLQNKILKILCMFVSSGVDEESRRLGSYYVMGSLTLVSQGAATACPWLFSAFHYENNTHS